MPVVLVRWIFFILTAIAAVLALNINTAEIEAAPGLRVSAVNGPLSDGSTVTVVGSGFGTKPTAAPLRFDDFENGSNGSAISTDRWKVLGTVPKYSNAIKRANSGMSVRAEFVNGEYVSSFGIQAQSLPSIYLDAWYYLDAVSPYSRNHKLFRIYTGHLGSTNLYYNLYCGSVSASYLYQDGLRSGNYAKWISPTAQYFAKKWVHIQGYFVESSPGADNGTARLWIDGVEHVREIGNFRTRESGAGNWQEIWLGNYFGNSADGTCPAYPGNAYTYWDDVYLDTTQARVEIGDASTYANARHREIQIPTAWSDGSITVRLNLGTFTSTSGLYLFVTDSSGNVSPGFPLTGGTTTTAPTAPKNLRIVP